MEIKINAGVKYLMIPLLWGVQHDGPLPHGVVCSVLKGDILLCEISLPRHL